MALSQNKNNIRSRWQTVIGLSLAFLIALIAQDIIREVLVFNQDVKVIADELERDVQNDVYDLVLNVETEVNFMLENLQEDSLVHAEENVSDLRFAVDALILLHDTLDHELEDDIGFITQTYNLNQSNHIYSLYTTDGIELYNGFTNTFSDCSDFPDPCIHQCSGISGRWRRVCDHVPRYLRNHHSFHTASYPRRNPRLSLRQRCQYLV